MKDGERGETRKAREGVNCRKAGDIFGASSRAEHLDESGITQDIVVRESMSILQAFAAKDETLLINRDAFGELDVRRNIGDHDGGRDEQGDPFASERFHTDGPVA